MTLKPTLQCCAPQTSSCSDPIQTIPHKRDFFKAISDGDLDGVKAYVEGGGDIEARNRFGESALIQLAQERMPSHQSIAQYLIQKGADVYSVLKCRNAFLFSYRNMSNALHVSAKCGNLPMVALLLQAKAPVNAYSGEDGYTALHSACRNTNTETAKILLDHRADPHMYTLGYKGPADTALSTAIWKKSSQLIQLLIESRADINLKSFYNGKPISSLSCAMRWNFKEAIPDLLSAGAEIEEVSSGILENIQDYGREYELLKQGCIQQIFEETVAGIICSYAQHQPEDGDVQVINYEYRKERLLQQVILITDLAKLISQYAPYEESDNLKVDGSIRFTMVSPGITLEDPRKRSGTSKIMQTQRKQLIAEHTSQCQPLVDLICEYAKLTKEDEAITYHTQFPALTKLAWRLETQIENADLRTHNINLILENFSDWFRERLYVEVFVRSKDPQKPIGCSPEEQLEWAKQNVGCDMRLFAEVLQVITLS